MATPRGRTRPGSVFLLAALVAVSLFTLRCDCRCRGCDAFASYYITQGQNLTYISYLFGILTLADIDRRVLPPNNLTNRDSIQTGARVNIPFTCGCVNGGLFGRFTYRAETGDSYLAIAEERYKNLTTVSALQGSNTYDATRIFPGVDVNVPVSCFCGDAAVTRDYGLFLTYPLRAGETLESVANATGFSDLEKLRAYNPTANSSVGQIIYLPIRGETL